MSDEMIHIKKVHVQGFKSILDAEVEFLPGLNVIIGKNGAGKSNLLAAVEGLLLGRRRTILSANVSANLLTAAGNIERYLSEGSNGKRINEVPKMLFFANTSAPEQRSWRFAEGDEGLAERQVAELVSIAHTLPRTIPFLITKFASKIGADDNQLRELLEAMSDPSLPYFCRTIVAHLYSQRSSWESVLDLRSAQEGVAMDLVVSALGLDDVAMQNVIDFTPVEDVRLNQDFSVAHFGDGLIQLNNIGYEFKVGENWHSFNDLSDGTQRMIYIILSICLPQNFLPLEYGEDFLLKKKLSHRIIFLEEPELGIHPHQLHQLLQFLKAQARKHQIIITTHSPQVLDVLGREELDRIVIATYDAKLGSQFEHLNEKQRSKALAYLKDMLLSDYWRFSDLEPHTNE